LIVSAAITATLDITPNAVKVTIQAKTDAAVVALSMVLRRVNVA